jgi:MFS family permease
VAVTLASLAYFTGDGVLVPAVPRYVQGPLAAGDVAVGLVVGAFSLSAFFLRPWVGGLGDRWGRRPLMVLGAGLFTVSVLGYGTASSPEALAGLRLLTGAGEACFFVGALTTVADLAPAQRRGEAMSLASLALYVGIGVGPLQGEVAIERSGFGAAWALALSAAGLAMVGAWRTPAGLVAGTAVFATGVALLTPAVMTLAVQGVAPRERGAVIGTTSSFLDLAIGLGPAALGLVAAAAGRPATFLASAAVAGAGLLMVVRRPGWK